MTTLEYQGHQAGVEPDLEAGILCGRVLNTHTVITFTAAGVEEILAKFHEAIDDYLAWCREDGIVPETPSPVPRQAAN